MDGGGEPGESSGPVKGDRKVEFLVNFTGNSQPVTGTTERDYAGSPQLEAEMVVETGPLLQLRFPL